jgi:hypothetical protein
MSKRMVTSGKEFFFTYSVILSGSIEARALTSVLIMILAYMISPDTANAYSGAKYQEICSKTLELMHGGFGALLMATAGVGAVVASAAGGFRIAWALVVVAVGAFTLKTYQELWTASCGGQ